MPIFDLPDNDVPPPSTIDIIVDQIIATSEDMRELWSPALDTYEPVKPDLTIRLNQDAVYVAIQPKELLLVSYVADEHGQPLPQARAVIAKAAAVTDQGGRFEINSPLTCPKATIRSPSPPSVASPGAARWCRVAIHCPCDSSRRRTVRSASWCRHPRRRAQAQRRP